jgi:hypothetical protein
MPCVDDIAFGSWGDGGRDQQQGWGRPSTEKLDGEMVAGICLRIEDLMLPKTNEELSNMSVALDNQN